MRTRRSGAYLRPLLVGNRSQPRQSRDCRTMWAKANYRFQCPHPRLHLARLHVDGREPRCQWMNPKFEESHFRYWSGNVSIGHGCQVNECFQQTKQDRVSDETQSCFNLITWSISMLRQAKLVLATAQGSSRRSPGGVRLALRAAVSSGPSIQSGEFVLASL